jgi:methylmalonyl-CoA/ethylmalonyl-CoA epimerase
MISRIDHIALAVKDQEQAVAFFRDVLGALPGDCYRADDRKFFWQTLVLGDQSRLEILSPSGEGSFLDGFLKSRPGGFHHITLQTPDLAAMIKRLEERGIPYFGRNEYPGGTWKEIFIHPRDAFGALVQIAEFDGAYWMVPEARMPEGERWRVEEHNGAFALHLAHPGGGKVTLEFTRAELEDLSGALRKAMQ